MKKRVHIIVSGLVQGVGFRFTVRYLANRYRLAGWVRNTYDGKVELEVEGTSPDIDNFLQDLQKEFRSNITDYKKDELPASGQDEGFHIRF
ncbi:MAG: acylphosphatase [Candidatus Omnitrophota bacterium]|nr:MAG: acylphosphatase [Candidatus Omnitrophota bacterium]